MQPSGLDLVTPCWLSKQTGQTALEIVCGPFDFLGDTWSNKWQTIIIDQHPLWQS
jgi:hypothetical protein